MTPAPRQWHGSALLHAHERLETRQASQRKDSIGWAQLEECSTCAPLACTRDVPAHTHPGSLTFHIIVISPSLAHTHQTKSLLQPLAGRLSALLASLLEPLRQVQQAEGGAQEGAGAAAAHLPPAQVQQLCAVLMAARSQGYMGQVCGATVCFGGAMSSW